MWFLSFIPFVGKIVDGFTAYFTKKIDADVEKYKVKGQIDVKAIEADTEVIRVRTDLAKARAGDDTDASGRKMLFVAVGLYILAYFYNATFDDLLPSYLTWTVRELNGDMKHVFFAVVAYLTITSFKK